MLSDHTKTLIYRVTNQEWPEFNGRIIEAQVLVESGGDPAATSGAGAIGLMQVTPDAAKDLGMHDPALLFDPEINLRFGVRYLKLQFDLMAEIPIWWERVCFALAAYNCGRGWVNIAISLAIQGCGLHSRRHPGDWQKWAVGGAYLAHPDCRKDGRRPDAKQILLYVAKVRATYDRLNQVHSGGS